MSIRRLVTVSLVMLLPGCIVAPPFIGGASSAPLEGGWLADPSAATFERWGERCGYRIADGTVELSRGDERLLLPDLVQPDGLLLRWSPHGGPIEFALGGGRSVIWDDESVAVDDEWYEFGRREPIRRPPLADSFEGRLGPQGIFARGQVWMSAVGDDLELHRSGWKMVLRDAVPAGGLPFTVDSFELPRVRFDLTNGSRVLWVRDRVWVDGALLAERGGSPTVLH